MPRKRRPVESSRGPIRVRATYTGPWTGAFKQGYGFWHIGWCFKVQDGVQMTIPRNLGVSCVQPLDVWVPIPDGAIGYVLFPDPETDTPGEIRRIPPPDSVDSKMPPGAAMTDPEEC